MRLHPLSLLLFGFLSTAASAQVGSWSPTSPPATGTPSDSAIVLAGTGEVMASYFGFVQRYNPYSNTWRTTQLICSPGYCDAHGLTELPSGQVLAEGTLTGRMGGAPSLMLYDPGADSWSHVTGIPQNKQETLTLLGSGKALLAGGYTYHYSNQIVVSETSEYDPVAGTSTPSGNMLTPRTGHTATLLYSGQVLVTGGRTTGDVGLASAELYDPSTRTWTAAGTMSRVRARHRALRLYSGYVLVLSDIEDASDTSVDLYDPYNARWLAGPPLPFSQPTSATMFYSGEVLVTNDAGQAAVYSPSQNVWLPAAPATPATQKGASVRLQTGEVLRLNGSSPTVERFTR